MGWNEVGRSEPLKAELVDSVELFVRRGGEVLEVSAYAVAGAIRLGDFDVGYVSGGSATESATGKHVSVDPPDVAVFPSGEDKKLLLYRLPSEQAS